jgi:hypothetical protein
MIQNVCSALEGIAREARNDPDGKNTKNAIESTRRQITDLKGKMDGHEFPLLDRLDHELLTWQSKLAAILKEPAGRQGMAKHAKFWVEELKKLGDGS